MKYALKKIFGRKKQSGIPPLSPLSLGAGPSSDVDALFYGVIASSLGADALSPSTGVFSLGAAVPSSSISPSAYAPLLASSPPLATLFTSSHVL